jgi:hypothetical protein
VLARSGAGRLLRLVGKPILRLDVPFVGRKSSAIGPPEHGRWDGEFYARPQLRIWHASTF